MKLALPKVSLPRPTFWDFMAVGALVVGLIVTALNLRSAIPSGPGQALSTSAAIVFTVAQLLVCTLSLTVLGKTAKSGTSLGNLAALGGVFVGLSGGLLAAALWAAA